jgi:hypothetical protein
MKLALSEEHGSIKTILNFEYWCNGTESFVLVLQGFYFHNLK